MCNSGRPVQILMGRAGIHIRTDLTKFTFPKRNRSEDPFKIDAIVLCQCCDRFVTENALWFMHSVSFKE